MKKNKTYTDVKGYAQKIADRFGWVLTGNEEMLDHLISGLMENFNRIGYYNCPCRDSQHDPARDRDIICPCVYARDSDVREYGRCYCALFFRKDFDMSQPISMIPERRPPLKDRRP